MRYRHIHKIFVEKDHVELVIWLKRIQGALKDRTGAITAKRGQHYSSQDRTRKAWTTSVQGFPVMLALEIIKKQIAIQTLANHDNSTCDQSKSKKFLG